VSAFVQSEALVRYAGRPEPAVGGRDHRGPSPLDRLYPVSDGWIRLLAGDTDPADVVLDGLDVATAEGIAGWLSSRTRDEAVSELLSAGLRAVPVREPAELLDDPVAIEHQLVRPDPRPGRWTAGRFAIFDRTQPAPTDAAPRLGEHSVEILVAAGLADDHVARLVDEGVVVQWQPRPK